MCDVSADEKRKSIADFGDSSFNPTKEKLCVSVKAMSALYLSKVAPLDSTRSLSVPVNICLLALQRDTAITIHTYQRYNYFDK